MITHNMYTWMLWLVLGSIVMGVCNLVLNLVIIFAK